jgi:hypothetical protein
MESAAPRLSGRGLAFGLGLVAAAALVYVFDAAVPYLRFTPEQFRSYWPRRWGLLLHIGAGTVALLSGPVQLWLGLAGRRVGLHRVLGAVYLGSVVLGVAAAWYLVFTTVFGWVFATGLAGLATAWMVTAVLAVLAVRRGHYEQHKEWMIRSYVVTTAFVTFRVFDDVLEAAGVGTVPQRLTVASWFCWAVPLLVTEAVLQGLKILTPARPR